jgi:hypothetical protein
VVAIASRFARVAVAADHFRLKVRRNKVVRSLRPDILLYRVENYSKLILRISLEKLEQLPNSWFSADVAEQRATTSSFLMKGWRAHGELPSFCHPY